ncbi:hypothetical protein GCM10022284_70530 [Streptomyces hundungensis]
MPGGTADGFTEGGQGAEGAPHALLRWARRNGVRTAGPGLLKARHAGSPPGRSTAVPALPRHAFGTCRRAAALLTLTWIPFADLRAAPSGTGLPLLPPPTVTVVA